MSHDCPPSYMFQCLTHTRGHVLGLLQRMALSQLIEYFSRMNSVTVKRYISCSRDSLMHKLRDYKRMTYGIIHVMNYVLTAKSQII